jgi:hypothetical protein
MGTDINFNKSLGRTYGTRIGLPAFDPAASAYFAATGITGATQQAAINDLVKGLKTDGLWSKMKAVYPFVTDNRNLSSYTESFNQWSFQATAVALDSTTAPNGTTTADSITELAVTDEHNRFQEISIASGQYTYSIHLKRLNSDWCALYVYNPSVGGIRHWINLSTLTAGTSANIGAGIGSAPLTIQNLGNGWIRASITFTATSGNWRLYIANAQSNGGATSYLGTLGNGLYAWGAQLEIGSTATTYQPIATTQQAYIASQFKYNLVNPVDSDAAFRLVFNGGWTHSSNGATPNGTNGYADTKLNQVGNLTASNNHISFYSRTDVVTANPIDAGCTNGTTFSFSQLSTKLAGNAVYENGSQTMSVANANSQGLYIGTSTSSTSAKLYKNGTSIASSTTAQTRTMFNLNVFVGSSNLNGTAFYFSSKQNAFTSIGDGLTDTEAANLYTRVQAYQTALNRQIP